MFTFRIENAGKIRFDVMRNNVVPESLVVTCIAMPKSSRLTH